MNRGELRDLASIWLDDTSNGYFTTTQLNTFLNNAQREVQKLLIDAGEDYYTKCVETTTVVNQKRYLLPDDFLKMLRLSYITGGSGDTATVRQIKQITRNEQDIVNFNRTGDPANFYFNKTTFALVPVPDTALTLMMDYAYRVVDMTDDSDVPDVPEDYHEYLAIMAARDGFLKDGRSLVPIERKLQHYENMLKRFAEQRNRGRARMIVATGDGFGHH